MENNVSIKFFKSYISFKKLNMHTYYMNENLQIIVYEEYFWDYQILKLTIAQMAEK